MSIAPLALTLGDPDGIGPEIALKAWSACRANAPFLIFADPEPLEAAASMLNLPEPQRVSGVEEARSNFDAGLPVLALPKQETAARSALASIDAAVKAAVTGEVGGIVTNPISKAALYKEGFRFPGHTEYIAHLTAAVEMKEERGPVMMLAGSDLRCALATIHMPLKAAIEALNTDRVIHIARVTAQALQRDFGLPSPRLALAGLNPHAGEGGALGREEIEILEPAAAALRKTGIDIIGPLPPDTMFHAEARAGYDAAICLYHDQGLIPVKTLDFHGGVNVTLGLPIIRTSPDHGTAFDIAGQGLARPDSLIAALHLADEMAANRAAAS